MLIASSSRRFWDRANNLRVVLSVFGSWPYDLANCSVAHALAQCCQIAGSLHDTCHVVRESPFVPVGITLRLDHFDKLVVMRELVCIDTINHAKVSRFFQKLPARFLRGSISWRDDRDAVFVWTRSEHRSLKTLNTFWAAICDMIRTLMGECFDVNKNE